MSLLDDTMIFSFGQGKKNKTAKMQNIIDIMEGIVYIENRRRGKMKNKRMKIARIEQDISQEELASLVGVTRQTIGLIEAGKYNPTLRLCVAICKALGKTLNDLFWEEP